MNLKLTLLASACAALLANAALVVAAVPAQQAATLGTTLTPLGAEKAGNADGSIPEWKGGLTTAVPGKQLGDIPVDLFSNEKPKFSIKAGNQAQYADKLSDGTRALLQKYPDTFRVDVYPTHRTAAAPDWVYKNTAQNAVNCKLTGAPGVAMQGCFGGIPFPIPQSGLEVIWNFLLMTQPESLEVGFKNLVLTSDGGRTLASRNNETLQFPYSYHDGVAQKWAGEYYLGRFDTTAPSFKVGEALVIRDSVDSNVSRQAWQYLVGQRRVRRAPTVGYDTPDFVASGANYFDEVRGYFGYPDRYVWKLVGKQEMIIPYNTNGWHGVTEDQAYTAHHLNPDHLRWESHRVWVVEATVAAGKRHAVPKRRFYIDEDSWALVLVDGYDAEGKLWRTTQVPSFSVPKLPGNLIITAGTYNLQANTLSVAQDLHEEYFRIVPRKPDNHFTGDAVAADATR